MRSKSIELMNRIKEFSETFYIEEGRSPSTTEIANEVGVSRGTAYRYLVDMAEKGMIEYDGSSIHTDATRKYKGSGTSATILDCSVSCGPGQLEEERILEYVRLPETVFGSGEMFLLRANGDSMVDAGIDDGDKVVLVDAVGGDIVPDVHSCRLLSLVLPQAGGVPSPRALSALAAARAAPPQGERPGRAPAERARGLPSFSHYTIRRDSPTRKRIHFFHKRLWGRGRRDLPHGRPAQ